MDKGWHIPPGGGEEVRGDFVFNADDSGEPQEMLYAAPNVHVTIPRDGDWILTDTYNMDGSIHLYIRHLPSKQFVQLTKLETHLDREQVLQSAGYYRIDLHLGFSPDGRTVSIDPLHEGPSREIYLLNIGRFRGNPPCRAG